MIIEFRFVVFTVFCCANSTHAIRYSLFYTLIVPLLERKRGFVVWQK